jgi:hypothetical protein
VYFSPFANSSGIPSGKAFVSKRVCLGPNMALKSILLPHFKVLSINNSILQTHSDLFHQLCKSSSAINPLGDFCENTGPD